MCPCILMQTKRQTEARGEKEMQMDTEGRKQRKILVGRHSDKETERDNQIGERQRQRWPTS